jgi:thiamine kinase-like enzyme
MAPNTGDNTESPNQDSTKNIMESVYDHAADLTKTQACDLLSSHLKGSWTSLSEEEIEVKVVTAGFVNRIFKCINKVTNEIVLTRLYGGKLDKWGDNFDVNIIRNIGIEGEVLVFHLMDINNIGPKLLSVFDGGRIEEYLEGYETLSDEDCSDDEIMRIFARQLSKLHSLDVPFKKTPKNFIKIIREGFEKYWPAYNDLMKTQEDFDWVTPQMRELKDLAIDYDIYELLDWFEETLKVIKTRIVFSHNDMNRANAMVNRNKETDNRVKLLDFEMTGYNYRGCDIGHHFKNRQFDIKKWSEDGAKTWDVSMPYPPEGSRRAFVREYLKIYSESHDLHELLDSEDHLLLEGEFHGALYQLFFDHLIMQSTEPIRNKTVPFHAASFMGRTIKDMEDRKKSVTDLMKRLRYPALN